MAAGSVAVEETISRAILIVLFPVESVKFPRPAPDVELLLELFVLPSRRGSFCVRFPSPNILFPPELLFWFCAESVTFDDAAVGSFQPLPSVSLLFCLSPAIPAPPTPRFPEPLFVRSIWTRSCETF